MGLTICSMGAFLPFVRMMVAMLAQVSTMVETKVALSQGLNKYVIIVYSDAISALVLLPCSLVIHRSNRTPLTFSLLFNFFLLSVFGCSAQIFGYVGLQYSSPTLGTAMLSLIPAFTFILAIILRLEKLDCRSKIGIAKSLGTIISIGGAVVVTFYKGPTLFSRHSHIIGEPLQLLHSPQLLWIIGSFFLAAEAFLDSAWYILQTFIVKKFPAVLIIIGYLRFFNTILSSIFLVAWCLNRTGPLYVSMFKPLAIIFAVIMDAIFLGDALSLGSLIGAIIIMTGFYAVLWGKAEEETTSEVNGAGSSESFSNNVPLLRSRAEGV
ncbi:hypothetical protein P3X46_015361 [Hevea brasiliensis]|uniref:WAT1-related protein n=1 Tax=Hevea brasiliensis TaxID=3981 RepID=A0ABQ9LZS5_HEVBR|nr:hypothetical protein P3X46_015361 [Hevea brasiliensis]